MIKYFNEDDNFDEIIKVGKTLVDFYATWCGPCRMFGEILEEYKDKNEELNILKVDIDKNMELAKRYGVMVVPTIILFENGEKKKEVTGMLSIEELDKFVS